MKPAINSRRLFEKTKLFVLDKYGSTHHSVVGSLDEFLERGDLLIINQSATLPSSFQGKVERTGKAVEIRLAAF